jgi:hypothetical protein
VDEQTKEAQRKAKDARRKAESRAAARALLAPTGAPPVDEQTKLKRQNDAARQAKHRARKKERKQDE